jgi:hypothetical protein
LLFFTVVPQTSHLSLIRNNIQTMMYYISERVDKTEEYDEATTRKLIAKVTTYDDYCRVQFKSGIEAEVKL